AMMALILQPALRQEGDVWTFMEFNELADVVRCDAVPCALALSEVYRDVAFEDAARRQPGIELPEPSR
ncbi:MAG: hypothetical protein ACRD9R_04890, partial [Pyrinomonadaceae bacterium]